MNTERCWAKIDTAALRHNAQVARSRVRPEVALLAVIKANAYGHGLAAVATALAAEVDVFGVANLHEAIEAREVVPHPVIILGPALPEERSEIAQRQFIPSVSSFAEASEFNQLAGGKSIAVNCEIDTGMGRMGITDDDALGELKAIAQLANVGIHTISTHLPSADEDSEFTRAQLSHFSELVASIRSALPSGCKVHALPSAGVLAFADASFDMVRAGLMLYGVSPQPELQDQLRPVLTWKTRIVLIRDLPANRSISYGRTFTTQRPTRVATLAAGYADGLPRLISNRDAAVLIGGRRCPILGRITMDMTMADVTDLPEAAVGDEAVLIGRQGNEEISAREMATRASTIAWEIFTGIGSRVARVYL
jgi:alanine racemase